MNRSSRWLSITWWFPFFLSRSTVWLCRSLCCFQNQALFTLLHNLLINCCCSLCPFIFFKFILIFTVYYPRSKLGILIWSLSLFNIKIEAYAFLHMLGYSHSFEHEVFSISSSLEVVLSFNYNYHLEPQGIRSGFSIWINKRTFILL